MSRKKTFDDQRITLRIQEKYLKFIDKIAKNRNKSRSKILRKALKSYIKQSEEYQEYKAKKQNKGKKPFSWTNVD